MKTSTASIEFVERPIVFTGDQSLASAILLRWRFSLVLSCGNRERLLLHFIAVIHIHHWYFRSQ
jgi:hypothetical protein